MTVLVTGGAGYIGSHTVRALRDAGRDVVVLDTLELGRRRRAARRAARRGRHPRRRRSSQQVCGDHGVTAIVHFAAYKSVGESMQSPGKYWHNNVDGTADARRGGDARRRARHRVLVVVLGVRHARRASRSSSRRRSRPESVYAESQGDGRADPPLVRRHQRACARSSLRYFNAAGASHDAAIGEDWTFSINLVPLVMKAVLGAGPPVKVFGDRLPDARRHVHPRLHPRRGSRRRPHPGARPARRPVGRRRSRSPSTSGPASARRCST